MQGESQLPGTDTELSELLLPQHAAELPLTAIFEIQEILEASAPLVYARRMGSTVTNVQFFSSIWRKSSPAPHSSTCLLSCTYTLETLITTRFTDCQSLHVVHHFMHIFNFLIWLLFPTVSSAVPLTCHISTGSIKGRRSSYLLAITTERSKSCDEGLNTFRDEGRMFSWVRHSGVSHHPWNIPTFSPSLTCVPLCSAANFRKEWKASLLMGWVLISSCPSWRALVILMHLVHPLLLLPVLQSLESLRAQEEARSKRHSTSELGTITFSDVRKEGWLHYKQILTEKGKVQQCGEHMLYTLHGRRWLMTTEADDSLWWPWRGTAEGTGSACVCVGNNNNHLDNLLWSVTVH